MNICVAGYGMIGSNVVRILEQQGHKVFVSDLKEKMDLREPRLCKQAVEGCDRVFHLADRTVGIGYSSTHHGQMMTDSLLISLNLLEAARKAGVKDYLYVSSSCVYPNYLTSPAKESTAHIDFPETANEGYGWGKTIAEKQCMYYAREYEIRTVIVRPANIYGPSYDWARPIEDMHVIPALICKMLRGDKEIVVWGSGKQSRMFQYEADAAQIMVELMDRGTSGEAYNLGGFNAQIGKLAENLAGLIGWSGIISFDQSKPEGPSRKSQDTQKVNKYIKSMTLDGLERTIAGAMESFR